MGMTDQAGPSQKSLADATRSRAKFSGHGDALGAAGKRAISFDPDNSTDLRQPGQSIALSPGEHGFEDILLGAQWHPIYRKEKGFLGQIMSLRKKVNVDLDLGCMYELEDGSRGAIQSFGEKWGDYDKPPFMKLNGDDRTGDKDGYDEIIRINGKYWNQIKRVLIYLYIYDGLPQWAAADPRVIVDVPGEEDLAVSLDVKDEHLPVCAVGGLENVRGGIKLTNYTEYFPGHAEMDRAFGYGLDWGDGKKRER
jgi:tellurite resistance protein TerA